MLLSNPPSLGNSSGLRVFERPMLRRAVRRWWPPALLSDQPVQAAWRAAYTTGRSNFGGKHLRGFVAASARRKKYDIAATEAEPPIVDAVESAEAAVMPAVDLLRHAPHGAPWPEQGAVLPQQWLAFSDLHVSHKTLAICLQVLEQVHEEASRRGAGILFLGDFWHTRGTLPVEPLNEVVRQLASWQQHTLMLPGNHDQVSVGGEVHALTPLAAANPAIHAFDGPAMFLNALWLPYRRNRAELEAALAAASAQSMAAAAAGGGGTTGPLLQGVFAHTDIIGALMNEAYQAHNGLPPDLFPPDIPTYTGHYHMPHTVAGSRITYIGSPYQVTRAEAGQEKRLLLLDRASGWEVAEQVRLDLGPRYFSAAAVPAQQAAAVPPPVSEAAADAALADGAAESAEGAVSADATGTSLEAVAADAGGIAEAAKAKAADFELVLPEGLRSGDRLLLTLPPAVAKQHQKRIKKLEKLGVQVEVFSPPEAAAAPRISAAEGMGPLQLWEHYSGWQRLLPTVAAAGAQLLRTLLGGASASGSGALEHQHTRLQFQAVEVEGYFSFREPVRYELDNRGLVVVTGQVQDTPEAGVESNGAGKTALVMAPLWALTGSVDSRAEGGAAGSKPLLADIINDEAKRARVRVEGLANGEPFVVERIANRKTSSVSFNLGGREMTTQENRLTQELIDELLGAELLGRVVFYGQSDIAALLEASDRAFKHELAKLVDLEVWARAKEASRAELSGRRDALRDASTTLRERQQQAAGLQQQLEELQAAAGKWQAVAMKAAAALQNEAADLLRRLRGQQQAVAAAVAGVQQQHTELASEVAELVQQVQELEQQKQALLQQLAARSKGCSSGTEELVAAEQRLAGAQQRQQALQEEQQRQQYELGGAARGAAETARQLEQAQAATAAAAAALQAFMRQNPGLSPGSADRPTAALKGLLEEQRRQLLEVQLAERALVAATVAAAGQRSRALAQQEAVERAEQEAAAALATAQHARVELSAAAAVGPTLTQAEVKEQQKSLQQRLAGAQQRLGTAQGLAREWRQQLDEYLQLSIGSSSTNGTIRISTNSTNGTTSTANGRYYITAAEHQPVATTVASPAEHVHGGDVAVCDRCLQPIGQKLFELNVRRLEAAATMALGEAKKAEQKVLELQDAQADLEAATALAERWEEQVAAVAAAEAAAAACAAAAAAAAREAQLAEALLADCNVAVAEAEAQLQRQYEVTEELLVDIKEADQAAGLKEQWQQLLQCPVESAAAEAGAAKRQQAAEQHLAGITASLQQLEGSAAEAAVAIEASQRKLQAVRQQGEHMVRLEQQQAMLQGRQQQLQQRQRLLQQHLEAAAELVGGSAEATAAGLEQLCGNDFGSSSSSCDSNAVGAEGEDAEVALKAAAAMARSCLAAAEGLQQRWRWHHQQPNLPARDAALVQQQLEAAVQQVAAVEQRQAELDTELAMWKQVDEAFLPRGIPNFVLEGVLGDLQAATSRNLRALTSGMSLVLNPCKPAAASKKKKKGGGGDEGDLVGGTIEQIEKIVHVCQPGSLEMRQRSMRQLSGGERRRVALALALGFSELAAQRGRLRSNMIVLDEVMQHLDGEGCLRVAQLLKQLPYTSILVVAQAHSLLTQAFDSTDVVVKSGGHSQVEQGSSAAIS